MRKLISIIIILAVMFLCFPAIPSSAWEDSSSSFGANRLSNVLKRAETEGFLYSFWGDDQLFDGTRIVFGTSQDMQRLKNSQKGTLIIRYQTEAAANQVLFAAGNNYSTNGYGAILVNNVNTVKKQRVDFPSGMYANLNNTTINSDWHTFVYSVDASSLPNTTGKTVTSFDGSNSTQYPNFASWFNANSTINNVQFLTIGGSQGTLYNSSNNQNFIGRIAFVAFIPDSLSQAEASALSNSNWPDVMYAASNMSILTSNDTFRFDSTALNAISELDEMTIIVQYKNTGNGIGSFFSISNTSRYDSHFHFYEYGNTIGYEFRNYDSPKYAATCGGVQSGEINTVAFKAEKNTGYKLFANGVLGSTVQKDSSSYQFISNLTLQNASHIGKTERSNK